jgi:deoxyribodipyrimidine photo-lyase
MEDTRAEAVFAEPDYSPFARRRDEAIEAELDLRWIGSPAVLPPGTVLKANGEPYTVFTPFSKAWKAVVSLPAGMVFQAPDWIDSSHRAASLEFPSEPQLESSVPFLPGEGEALRRLDWFTRPEHLPPGWGEPPIYDYSNGRDQLDQDATSGLSPYLRFGMLSARQAAFTALRLIEAEESADRRKGAETWLNELIWRDFYIHILYHFPRLLRQNFRLEKIRWVNDPAQFEAWKAGCTGYPLVDAAMRQLSQTGWMHNRARMVTASFLTKDLLIDWRWGAAWFMNNLVDGDPAANSGGWQWSAGTGTDAAPYFRIFNPQSQSLKHDPQGRFIRRWLPELAGVPDAFVHHPWTMPAEVQRSCGVKIGRHYPAPIVDHAEARVRALQVYRNG